MNKKLFFTATGSICFLFIGFICNAQSSGILTINATNLKTDKGVAVVHLFRKQDDVPKKPFKEASHVIDNHKSKIVFRNLPYGEYAAILFHDENSNGILDHRFGFPNEPMGFSNDWKLSLFSGMPTFQKLRFEFREGKTTCLIAIR
jgi:uncharacterized protein (DUF2141 family)